MNQTVTNGLRKNFERLFTKRAKSALNKSVERVLQFSKSSVSNLDMYVTEEPIRKLYQDLYNVVAYQFGKLEYDNLVGKKKDLTNVPEILNLSSGFESVMQQYLQNYALSEVAIRITGITNTTRRFIQTTIAEALQEGYSVEKTGKILRAKWRKLSQSRAVLIVRTEVMAASNAGALVGAGASGLNLKKEWMATRDKRTRDPHLAAHGQQKDLDEPFLVDGELLQHPGDGSLGASTSNIVMCRCAQRFRPI